MRAVLFVSSAIRGSKGVLALFRSQQIQISPESTGSTYFTSTENLENPLLLPQCPSFYQCENLEIKRFSSLSNTLTPVGWHLVMDTFA